MMMNEDIEQILTDPKATTDELRSVIEALTAELAETRRERQGIIAQSNMHPSWTEKSKKELLDALRFQGATTHALLEETESLRAEIDTLRAASAGPVAWVIECNEVDEDNVPIRWRDIDWNTTIVDELPIGTPLFAAPQPASAKGESK